MNCKIIAIDNFRREAKWLIKKFPSLKSELETLQNDLLQNPRLGTLIHENIYKIRLAVKSKGKGKSGGMRVITYVVEVEIQIEERETDSEITIFLVSIYDKSEQANISERELRDIIDEINAELDNEE
ncbi:MAG: hypothetical protein KA138_06840 [Saprospiraceae bacterium]|jgi:mRNA-degrading endonuclease RelE of RelBE toxin-antitoxin system|nr:hypothetical protein [Lewinellaceae bacterium]MBP6811216.1 hypothetical protein [Saprospiraceae bacterium]